MRLDPRTPVLVGAGVAQQRSEDPLTQGEALDLMVAAVRAAGSDAGGTSLIDQAGWIMVPQGTWSYDDPGALVAQRLGCSARTTLAEVGVLQQTLLTRASAAIVRGHADVVVVCGGEAKYRVQRAAMTGVAVSDTPPQGRVPDQVLRPEAEIVTKLEIDRSLPVPAHQYAVLENALRFHEALTVADHRVELGRLWSSFSEVAAANPDAWQRRVVPPDDIVKPGPGNRMIAFPYTKLLNSQWNVNQAAALILCTAEVARRQRVPIEKWVYPLTAAESNAMIPLSQRAQLHRCPGFRAAANRALDLAGLGIDDVGHIDLYSCFPAAVRIQQRELGIGADRAMTVTGGMTFAGGPLNNYVLQSTAKMAEILRQDPASVGMVTSVSGMLTKQGVGLWSSRAPDRGFRWEDVSAETRRRTDTKVVVEDHDGSGVIAGYTVVYRHDQPWRAVAIADLPDGSRTIAVTDDPSAAATMTWGEWCGRPVQINGSKLSLVE